MNIEVLTLPEIRDVYRHQLTYDFPDDERKPLSWIEKLLKRGRYLCYGLKDGSGIAAYAFFAVIGNDNLLDYFAVRKDLRGTGVGSGFLRELYGEQFRNASSVLVEVDDPACADSGEEKAVRERRLAFYLKNGLWDTGARCRTFGVRFMILEFPAGNAHNREKAGEIYSRIYRAMLPKRICARMVEII